MYKKILCLVETNIIKYSVIYSINLNELFNRFSTSWYGQSSEICFTFNASVKQDWCWQKCGLKCVGAEYKHDNNHTDTITHDNYINDNDINTIII